MRREQWGSTWAQAPTVLCLLPLTLLLNGLLFAPATFAEDPNADLTELSLEQLADVEVTTLSKKQERLATAADAIFVLTGAEIRRSGATSIPEALRLVPGVQARIAVERAGLQISSQLLKVADKVITSGARP